MPLPYRIVLLQLATSFVAAGALLLISPEQSLAALLAGIVCIAPGGYFAWRAQRERSPGRLLGQGALKFVLTLSLMALVFVLYKPPPLGFFATFVLIQAMYVVGSLRYPGGSQS